MWDWENSFIKRIFFSEFVRFHRPGEKIEIENRGVRYGVLRRYPTTLYEPSNEMFNCDSTELDECLKRHLEDTKELKVHEECRGLMEKFKKQCGLRR